MGNVCLEKHLLTKGTFGLSNEYSTALYTNANEPTTTRKQFKTAIRLRFISRTRFGQN